MSRAKHTPTMRGVGGGVREREGKRKSERKSKRGSASELDNCTFVFILCGQ